MINPRKNGGFRRTMKNQIGLRHLYSLWLDKYTNGYINDLNDNYEYEGNLKIKAGYDNSIYNEEHYVLKINGNLDIRNTSISKLPEGLNVRSLWADYTPFAERVFNDELENYEKEIIEKTQNFWLF